MTNTTTQLFIDLDNPAPLDEPEWIGRGKVYPTLNPPRELVVYRDRHLGIGYARFYLMVASLSKNFLQNLWLRARMH